MVVVVNWLVPGKPEDPRFGFVVSHFDMVEFAGRLEALGVVATPLTRASRPPRHRRKK